MNDLATTLVNQSKQEISAEMVALTNMIQRRPYLTCRINNDFEVRALYDTGADITCISLDTFEKIKKEERFRRGSSNVDFKAADGQKLRVHGRYIIAIRTLGKTLLHLCHVIADLNEPLIIGMDFIRRYQLHLCPKDGRFFWGTNTWSQGHVKTIQETTLPPFSSIKIKVNLVTETGCKPVSRENCLMNVAYEESPLLTGGPAMIQPDELGQAQILVYNCGPLEIEIPRGRKIGLIENLEGCELRQLNPAYVNAIQQPPPLPLPTEKLKYIEETLTKTVPSQHYEAYKRVILKNHAVISRHKFDLGRTETLLHEISLKTDEPIYVKQFKIPDAHRLEVEKHVLE
jgi:hypothetical protein